MADGGQFDKTVGKRMRLHGWVSASLSLADVEWLCEVLAAVEQGDADVLRVLAVDRRGAKMLERMKFLRRRAKTKATLQPELRRKISADQERDVAVDLDKIRKPNGRMPHHGVARVAERHGLTHWQVERVSILRRKELRSGKSPA